MKNGTSIYLDFLRVFSAFAVLFFHSSLYFFSNNIIPEINGHQFVIVFFVLSGYVIAYSSENKSIETYFTDRISRLYSVIIPVLLITFIVDNIGMRVNPSLYNQHITPGHYLFRYIITFFNMQEIGTLSSRVSTNITFWSLAYEFWYYVIFGLFIYIKPSFTKFLVLLIILILFYKITILMPVWLAGAFAYTISKRYKPNNVVKGIGSIVTFFVIASFLLKLLPLPFPCFFNIFKSPFYFSSDFINDYFIGAITALNLFFISEISFNVKSFFLEKTCIIIRYISSITFTLYLLHFPLLLFFGEVIPYNKSNTWHVLLLLTAIVLLIVVIGRNIENKRIHFKKYIEKQILSLKLKANK